MYSLLRVVPNMKGSSIILLSCVSDVCATCDTCPSKLGGSPHNHGYDGWGQSPLAKDRTACRNKICELVRLGPSEYDYDDEWSSKILPRLAWSVVFNILKPKNPSATEMKWWRSNQMLFFCPDRGKSVGCVHKDKHTLLLGVMCLGVF